MPQAVNEQVEIPAPVKEPPNGPQVLSMRWAVQLAMSLRPVFFNIGQRLNGSIHKDGEIGMEAPFKLKEYTVATRPDPADFPWTVIAVTDGGAGAEFQGSNGTSWVNLG